MSAASDYLENKVLNHVLRGAAGAYTAPTTLYAALFLSATSVPTTTANLEAGTLTDEVPTSGSTAYARTTIAFDAAASGQSQSTATVTFPAATATWGNITHVAITDSGTRAAGNVLFYGTLTTAKTVASGDTFQISAGNMTVSLA